MLFENVFTSSGFNVPSFLKHTPAKTQMDDAESNQPMRPNDLCTAAYYNDIPKIKELLTVPEVEEEPPLAEDFDPADPVEEDEDAKEAEAERSTQRAANDLHIKTLLSSTNVLVTRLSPVNIKKFGLFLRIEDRSTKTEKQVKSTFKCSPHSTYAASPLHWAALGRSHEAIEYLILKGADTEQKCPIFNVTPAELCGINHSHETAKVIAKSIQKRDAIKAEADAAKEALGAVIAERAAAVAEHLRKVAEEEEAERLQEERGDEGDENVTGYNEGEEYDEEEQ